MKYFYTRIWTCWFSRDIRFLKVYIQYEQGSWRFL